MQNLKEIKKVLEEQIQARQHHLNIINQAIAIAENTTEEKESDFLSSLRKTADSFLNPEEIEKAILKINEDFQANDVHTSINKLFPGKTASNNAIGTALHQLIKAKKLRYVRERKGRRPAVYHKS